ncbi:MAG TPA: hypothetical protein VFF06_17295 [Polyangia bacterium]|nr:hypothetical protein [Polyangia bacterium]
MSPLRMLLLVLVLTFALPLAAHASAGASGAVARDWAPCLLALAALGLRVRRFARRSR